MDQDAIVAALGSRALLVQLHGLNGLKANSLGLMGVRLRCNLQGPGRPYAPRTLLDR